MPPNGSNTTFVHSSRNLTKFKNKILVNDIDNAAKKIANNHCKQILTAIMEGKLKSKPNPKEAKDVQAILQVVLGSTFVYRPEATIKIPASESRTLSTSLSPATVALNHHSATGSDLVQKTNNLAEQLRIQEMEHQKQLRELREENRAREKRLETQMAEMLIQFQKLTSSLPGSNGNQVLALAMPFAVGNGQSDAQDSLVVMDERVKRLERGQLVLNQAVLKETDTAHLSQYRSKPFDEKEKEEVNVRSSLFAAVSNVRKN